MRKNRMKLVEGWKIGEPKEEKEKKVMEIKNEKGVTMRRINKGKKKMGEGYWRQKNKTRS